MMRHPAVWFVAGIGAAYAYHKFIKPVPSNKTA